MREKEVSNRIEKKLLYGSGGLVQASDSGRPQQGEAHRKALSIDAYCKRLLRFLYHFTFNCIGVPLRAYGLISIRRSDEQE